MNAPTPAALSGFFAEHDLAEPVSVERISFGQSNPSFICALANSTKVVVRCRPVGLLLKTAHRIEREFGVLKRLKNYDSSFPCPTPFAFCDDVDVLGTEFYVMEFVDGVVFRDMQMKNLKPHERSKVVESLMETLFKLHAVDCEKAGLIEFLGKHGKPPTKSYLRRQTKTWLLNFQQSTVERDEELEEKVSNLAFHFERVCDDLESEWRSNDLKLIHGDYKIDNVIFDSKTLTVKSIVDWEICTLGRDVKCELGYCLQGYLSTSSSLIGGAFASNGFLPEGLPTLEQALEFYSPHAVLPPVFKAYTNWRLACIIQAIIARAVRKTASQVVVFNSKDVHSFVDCALRQAFPFSESKLPIIPQMSSKAVDKYRELLAFMDEFVYPNEQVYEAQACLEPTKTPRVVSVIREEAKQRGLFNFFNRDIAEYYNAHLKNPDHSDAPLLSAREYASFAEVTGRNLWVATCFMTQFPDTGNAETLFKFGTAEQKTTWLNPLLKGQITTSFVMTEPQVASSDARQISTTIDSIGDSYVINGEKIWITGIGSESCKLLLILGRTSSAGDPLKRHSIVLVPRETPGIFVGEPMKLFNFDDMNHGGHCVVSLKNVKVPKANLLFKEGLGFSIAQTRLGPGRLHHAARCVGHAQRALELTVERMRARSVKGVSFTDLGVLRAEIAESAVSVEQSRLLVLRAAVSSDVFGAKASRGLISACKVRVMDDALKIIDRGMQVFGGLGMSQYTPLAALYARVDSARRMDGPSATHRETMAKMFLSESHL